MLQRAQPGTSTVTMPSPAGLQFSQEDFLARWMPSSTRAGVILKPCTDLTDSLRPTSAVGSPSLGPDDSFTSNFAPLPTSADSSFLCVDGSPGGEGAAATDSPLSSQTSVAQRNPVGGLDNLNEMASTSHDLPSMMKLEQLRKWHQHMKQTLETHQLEELLYLQEEHQKLLGMINSSRDSTGGSSREDEQEQSFDTECHENNSGEVTEDDSRIEDKDFHDRAIRGQKKTFEELLEEQLRMEEQRLQSARQQQSQDGGEAVQALPKRAFLRRGQGLSRFTNGKQKHDPKPQAQARVISRRNSEPTAIQRGITNGAPRLLAQHKTTTLNKENQLRGLSLPLRDINVVSKGTQAKVLGSHQRQNTRGSESIRSDPEGKQHKHQLGKVKEQNNRKGSLSSQTTRNPGHNTQQNPVTKQVGMAIQPEREEDEASGGKSCGSRVKSAKGTAPSDGGGGGRGGGGGGQGAPKDSFELSFHEKLQRWECDLHLESYELGEFELLEQAAEELSFSSNSSFVMKVLQMDQLKAANGGLLPRRLSSTPKKSPGGALQMCSGAGTSGTVAGKSRSVTSEAFVLRDDALQDKVSIEEEEEQESGRGDRHGSSDVSSLSGSEFEGQEVVVKPPLFPSTCFPAQSNPPYDKRSYQDEDSCGDSASHVTGADDGESDFSNADEYTLTEDKDRVVFDDNDTWNDLEDTAVDAANDGGGVCKATANGVSPQERTLMRKVAVSKVVELKKDTAIGSANPDSNSPPASQLMTRLFPSLKPKAQNAPLPPPPASSVVSESEKPAVETGQQVQSRLLRERLVELEIEIERFKKENAALSKLRQENEIKQENIRKERLQFEQIKAAELAKFEEYQKEESRKLQRERKLFENHASAVRAMPDKKEREEIQVLKQQLNSLQEELRGKESRWASTQIRMRQQIDSLRQENTSLQDEIRMLEKLRLSAWKKTSCNTDKDKEMKDSPRILDSNVSSVSKGVKFACPLDSRGSSGSPPRSSTAVATRRTSRDYSQGATAGMKSSLKRAARPGSSSSVPSSSSLPGRRTEERSTTATKSQDKPPNQETSDICSPETDSPPNEPERSESVLEVITHPDGKVEKVLASGDRLVSFPNGTRKEVSADGLTVKVTFFNGDTKQITDDQRVIYYYAEVQTTHITYPDGMEVLHFPNNQTERHFPDGRKEITFPDQTVKNLFPNGREESVLTDGTIIQVDPGGTKEIHFNTGQREIHTADYKRREYPDGTCKTVYTDGRQETHYPTGRLRIKDKDGKVIVDNKV